MSVLWVEVTQDEYELPVAVTDSAAELSRMRGYRPDKVVKEYYRWTHGLINNCKYRRVEIDDEPNHDS